MKINHAAGKFYYCASLCGNAIILMENTRMYVLIGTIKIRECHG